MRSVGSLELIELLTVGEACRRLSISRSHFYELVASEKLKLRKVGAASRVIGSELNAYIAGLPAVSVAARVRR